MPLSSGHPTLKSELETAYYIARDDGAEGVDVIPRLASDVGNAVHKYMETALVSTDITTPGTQTSTAAASTSGTPGTYTSPGTGTGTGTISFTGDNVSTMIGEIEAAYYKARDDGAEGIDVIPGLAADMKAAIHKFALTAKVETDVVVNPGQVITGYMAIAGTTTVPVPATSLVGAGSGEGALS